MNNNVYSLTGNIILSYLLVGRVEKNVLGSKYPSLCFIKQLGPCQLLGFQRCCAIKIDTNAAH